MRVAARAIMRLEPTGNLDEDDLRSKNHFPRIEALGIETRRIRFHPSKAKHRTENIFAEPMPVRLRREMIENAIDLLPHCPLVQMDEQVRRFTIPVVLR